LPFDHHCNRIVFLLLLLLLFLYDISNRVFSSSSVVRPVNINKQIEYPNSGHQKAIIDADGWKLIDQHVKGPVLNYDGWFPWDRNSIPAPPNPTPNKYLFK
jgi:hypothetical protein